MSDAVPKFFARAVEKAQATHRAREAHRREAGQASQWSEAELASALASDPKLGESVIAMLLDEAWSARSSDPRRSCAWADRAYRCLEVLEETRAQTILLARALRIRGNARRILGDLAAAAEDLAFAIDLSEIGLDMFGMGQGRRFLSTVHSERGEFRVAEGLATRAVVNFRLAGEIEEVLETRLCRGRIRSWGGMPRAMGDFAAVLVHTREFPRAAMAAHNAADHLARKGHFEPAVQMLTLAESFFDAAGISDHPNRLWIRGRIALGLGRYAEAEQLLESAIRDCQAQDRQIDAAEATLELCLVYAAQGRMGSLVRCARAAGKLLASAGVAEANVATHLIAEVRRKARERSALADVGLLQRAIEAVRSARWLR